MNYKSCKHIFDRAAKWYIKASKEARYKRGEHSKDFSDTDWSIIRIIPFVSLFGGYYFAKYEKNNYNDSRFNFAMGSVLSVIPATFGAIIWCHPKAIIFTSVTAFIFKVIPYIV